MKKGVSKSNTYLHNRKVIQQAKENRLDKICWQTQKEYPYTQGMGLTTIWEYVELGSESVKPYGLYFYDFDKMIEQYRSEVAYIPSQIIKDKHSLGPITHLLVYSIRDIDNVLRYFSEVKDPILFEYISLKDFVSAIKGDEDFYTVRTRWYKRLEKINASQDGIPKRRNDIDLSNVTIEKLPDELNSNKRTSAFFYNLKDLLRVDELYRNKDKRKAARKK